VSSVTDTMRTGWLVCGLTYFIVVTNQWILVLALVTLVILMGRQLLADCDRWVKHS